MISVTIQIFSFCKDKFHVADGFSLLSLTSTVNDELKAFLDDANLEICGDNMVMLSYAWCCATNNFLW